MVNKKQAANRNKIFILLASLLLVVAAASFVWWKTHRAEPVTSTTTQSDGAKIDLSPATEADKEDSNSHKTADTTPQQTTQDQKYTVTPVIVDASQYGEQVEVRSYVSGIVESGGTCTFTFSKSSASFQRQSTATADATTSICPSVSVASADFSSKGTWSVAVSYDSTKASGTSNSVKVEVK